MESLFLEQFLELLDTGSWSAPTRAAVEAAGGLAFLRAGFEARGWPAVRFRHKKVLTLEAYLQAFAFTYQRPTAPSGRVRALKNTLRLLVLRGDAARLGQLQPAEYDYQEVYMQALRQRQLQLAALLEPYLPTVFDHCKFYRQMCRLALRRQLETVFSRLLVKIFGTSARDHAMPLLAAPVVIMAWRAGDDYLALALQRLQESSSDFKYLQMAIESLTRQHRRQLSEPTFELLLSYGQLGLSKKIYLPAVITEARLELLLSLGLYKPATVVSRLFSYAPTHVLSHGLRLVPGLHPLALAEYALRGNNVAAVELLQQLYPLLTLEMAAWSRQRGGDIVKALQNDHGRRLWRRLLPLMRDLAMEIYHQRLPSLQVQVRLSLVGPEARWSMLSWWVSLMLESDRRRQYMLLLDPFQTTPGAVVNYLRGMFELGLSPELLLVLGFQEPLDNLSRELCVRVARYLVAYGQPSAVERILRQHSFSNLELWQLLSVSVTYDRPKMLLLLLGQPGASRSATLDLARRYGRTRLYPLLGA